MGFLRRIPLFKDHCITAHNTVSRNARSSLKVNYLDGTLKKIRDKLLSKRATFKISCMNNICGFPVLYLHLKSPLIILGLRARRTTVQKINTTELDIFAFICYNG